MASIVVLCLLFFMYTKCMMRCPSWSSLVVGGRFFPAIHGYIKMLLCQHVKVCVGGSSQLLT
ncbi:hypothetical protein ACB092_03G059300 [Castanea dentata]